MANIEVRLKNMLLTHNHSIPLHDEKNFNNYLICDSLENSKILTAIRFQEGNIKDNGINGIFMEDLIAICIHRLEHFQETKFNCIENTTAIYHLEEALRNLNDRTEKRNERGVLDTDEI